MSPINIHGAERPLARIFSNEYVFSVPNYQRPYAWDEEHAGELLEDIRTAMTNGKSFIEEYNPYFLGSIVLIKGDTPEAQIIDGQQRLVTLTILLSVIRSLLQPNEADSITKMLYEEENIILGTPNRYRLTIKEKDQIDFQTYIQHKDGLKKLEELKTRSSESIKNIYLNASLYLSKLKELQHIQILHLVQFIIKRCFLVVVSTPDFDSAYRIFSILNDRGLALSLTDILKAEIIGNIGKIDEDLYTRKWEDIEDSLGRDAFKDLFAHIRMIYVKAKLRTTALKEIRDIVRPTENPRNFIDEKLIPLSDAFSQVKNANFESATGAEKINKLLIYLNRIDNFDWQPPTIAYMISHKCKSDDLYLYLSDLERLAVGMMIIRVDINYRLERYGRLLKAIEDRENLYHDGSPLKLTDEERIKIIEALNGNIYEVVKIRMPVLLRLDETLSDGTAKYDYPVITVEHVLPQNPSTDSEWMKLWPDEKIRLDYVHRLGNLALLSRRKNSQAQNFDFDKKKKEYFQKGGIVTFAITTQVLNENKWTLETVENRQRLFLSTLKKIWRL